MSVRMKRGVVLMGREPCIFEMIQAARIAYGKLGKDVVITSCVDGTHSTKSLHYHGRALDFRTSHLTDSQRVEITDDLKVLLGDDYDVCFEGNHLHLELDPQPDRAVRPTSPDWRETT